jgi:hypothetical protein
VLAPGHSLGCSLELLGLHRAATIRRAAEPHEHDPQVARGILDLREPLVKPEKRLLYELLGNGSRADDQVREPDEAGAGITIEILERLPVQIGNR